MKTISDWSSPEHAINYLSRADTIPHRTEGESVLLEELPDDSQNILDIGAGNGRLLDLCLLKCKRAQGTALDFSQTMLECLYDKYQNNQKIKIIEHDLNDPLPFQPESFDAVVSSFAIHHVDDIRKFELYNEIWRIVRKGGIFCNLEHVSSPTENLHKIFYEKLGVEEDESNKLLNVETQLKWLTEIGFEDVDCYWKWRELALIIGKKNYELLL
jgi:tRNA (cmo5U34)-methyltransferase